MKRTAGRAMCQHIAKNAVASTAIAMVDLHALRRMEHLMEQLDPDSALRLHCHPEKFPIEFVAMVNETVRVDWIAFTTRSTVDST